MIETVKRLNRELAKLEHFKKNLLQQLQDEEQVMQKKNLWLSALGLITADHACSSPSGVYPATTAGTKCPLPVGFS